MKNLLGIIFLTLSVSAQALTCTSMGDEGLKTIEISTLNGGVSLLSINEDGDLSYMIATKTQNSFSASEKYLAFNQLGVEFKLSISQPIHHCRARICNANPFSPKFGVLSSVGLENEFFDCL